MALLLNVRRLSQAASNAASSIDAAFWPRKMSTSTSIPVRNESSQFLVESGAEADQKYLSDYEQRHGAFRNPSFQADISYDENSNYPPSSSDGQLTDFGDEPCVQISNLDTSSADSGINAGYTPDSLKEKPLTEDSDILKKDISTKCNSSPDSGIVSPQKTLPSINGDVFPQQRRKSSRISLPSLPIKFPRLPSISKDPEKQGYDSDESLLATCLQVFFPFLIAGIGTCGAGLVLDTVEGWDVFKEISEIFILVPTLLGLKGNLEMTLASRVSTQVNLGKVQSWQNRWSVSWGNMALVQCQATVMAFLSSCFATAMSAANNSDKPFEWYRALLLGASALFTASLASLVLGALTLIVVLAAHKFNINPDNIATPLAASIGDVTTLGVLAAIATYFREFQDNILPSTICIVFFMSLVPLWAYMSYKNSYVRAVLFNGWTPVIAAVAITSAGGYILEISVSEFKGLAVFQPVINGVAGNLVAVQASRISTYFHGHSVPGSKPPDGSSLCISPLATFYSKSGPHARTARVLIAMVIPGHLLFGYGIVLIKGGNTALTPTFLPIYLAAAVIQVAVLLYIAQCMIQILWLFKIDPDNSAIPLLTALGDLSGMIALSAAFLLHRTLVPVAEEQDLMSLNSTTSMSDVYVTTVGV